MIDARAQEHAYATPCARWHATVVPRHTPTAVHRGSPWAFACACGGKSDDFKNATAVAIEGMLRHKIPIRLLQFTILNLFIVGFRFYRFPKQKFEIISFTIENTHNIDRIPFVSIKRKVIARDPKSVSSR